MTNHPNRGWRSRWSVDLESATATHRDGWAFSFTPDPDEQGGFCGACTAQPEQLTAAQIAQVQRLAREAGEIYIEARAARH